MVDDEEAIRTSLRSILEDEGYEVSVAANGVEALKVYGTDPPDLMILDIWMPEMDGLAATSLLKAMPVPPRVFLVTLLDTPGYQRRAEAVGADAFIPKTNFAEAVQGALDTLLEVPEQGS